MSLARIPIDPDPFNLPPEWWGRVTVPADAKGRERLRVMAAIGDGPSMIGFSALEKDDVTVRWFRTALKYQKQDAQHLVDYWMCALGLCEIRSADVVRSHMKAWVNRTMCGSDDDLSMMLTARIRNIAPEEIRRYEAETKVRSILSKLEAFSKDESEGRILVCRLLGQALSGDVEAQFYFFESLRRIEDSKFTIYASGGSKRLRTLMHSDAWDSSLSAERIRQERRSGFRPTKAALAEKSMMDAADKAEKDAQSRSERVSFQKKCAEIEHEVRRLEKESGGVCCVCHKTLGDTGRTFKKKFTYAITLTNGCDVPHTVEVSIPRCLNCQSEADEHKRIYDEEQQKRKIGKSKEDNIRRRGYNVMRVLGVVLLLPPIAAWVAWGFWPFAGIEVLSVIILGKIGEISSNWTKESIRRLYKDIPRPDERFYRNYGPVKVLFDKGYQEGSSYSKPIIRF